MMDSTELNDRSSPLGYWNFARTFFEAGGVVADNKKTCISAPAYYLYAHALELILKSFLRCKEVTVERLRSRDLGHDLYEILKEARQKGLEVYVRLSPEQEAIIENISLYYKNKDFEYFLRGTIRLPELNDSNQQSLSY